MPIMPLEEFPPLPKHDTEKYRQLREEDACPIQTFDWYRLPKLFNLCKDLFGPAFYNAKSKIRQQTDKHLTTVCEQTRDRYMPQCSHERMAACCRLLEDAAEAVMHYGPDDQDARRAYFTTTLKNLLNTQK